MLEVIDLSQDVTLIEAASAEVAVSRRDQLLAQVRNHQDEARAALKNQANALEKSYEDALHGSIDPRRLADTILDKERADGERIRPAIEGLQQKLAAHAATLAPEIMQPIQENLRILKAWLALYREFHERLLALAAERGAFEAKILQARPLQGPIDYDALHREVIARFPKILAALAK